MNNPFSTIHTTKYEFEVHRKCRLCGETFIDRDYQRTMSGMSFYNALTDYQRGYDKHALHRCADGKIGISDILGNKELSE